MKTWEHNENPTAKVQNGDPDYLIQLYEKNGCTIEEAEHGYRSVHYLVNQPMGKSNYQVEIQVRTLFEEAWAECDHAIRYPELADHDLLSEFMGKMALFAGLSDELSGLALEFKIIKALEYTASTDEEKLELLKAAELFQDQDETIKKLYEERLRNAYPQLKVDS
ncbi:MAG: hypothetical protein OEV80_04560, partial [candidate division Zixibacteria bacterium]|nr:hypothetical protein [candidate division Zixibacteria bacterium]